jgi:hypothetical protein
MIDGNIQCAAGYWTDSQIRGVIPGDISHGGHTLTVVREPEVSNSFAFTVGDAVNPDVPAAPGAELPIAAQWDAHVEAGNHAAVDIPANAMADDNYILVGAATVDTSLAAAMLGSEGTIYVAPAGPLISFGPDGLQFASPATITVPYDKASIPPGKTENDLVIYNWNETAGAWIPLATTILNGRAQADTWHFSLYQVMASGVNPLAASAFALHQFYVYPNPARGGNRPTLHIECGIGDGVDIRIYDVAGELRHSAHIAGGPTVSAPQYAYEYVWNMSGAGSGVYTAVVEARKGGAVIKATKKFAIIK